MMEFKLAANYQAAGDQPQAIDKLSRGLVRGDHEQTLLGVTGSGKTFTMANVIARSQRPTLIISHNKTLAAQLYGEFKEFFPHNAVHYFVSYYDYYQPEAYMPQTDTYIEKETQINEEIDRLRHAATQALLTRNDVIIVASVSCIYGLGEKVNYENQSLRFQSGEYIKRNEILRQLIKIQYSRDDEQFKRGQFRVLGERIDIHLSTGEEIIRLELDGEKIAGIYSFAMKPGKEVAWTLNLKNIQGTALKQVMILPAKHFVAPEQQIVSGIAAIEEELDQQVKQLLADGKLVEAERLQRKTSYDLEMMKAVGYCNGIENYSRPLSGRAAGAPPETLIDFFPPDYLLMVDESHVTLPQIRGMFAGDRSRKQTLIDFGFRLPSALDNRPLNFKEFKNKINQAIYVSATPADYELSHAKQVVQQIIRPTGLLDPVIEVRNSDNQIEDLVAEIKSRLKKKQRVLAITLTKRMAEELASYLAELGIKVAYIHSEVKTMERVEILTALKDGVYDVLVGINLLREGIDLPEVSLVAILNADMAGFLRTETSLIQTIGRAARHAEGKAILYGRKISPAMRIAIDITKRRRKLQETYNHKHGITPKSVKSKGLVKLGGE
jgi:excinuclease ABC subunit B